MEKYTAEDLKVPFPELGKYNEFTLVPLLDGLFERWVEQLPNETITDIQKDREDQFARNSSYTCVVNGKLVRIGVYRVDIDVVDEDEHWYMAKTLIFDDFSGRNMENKKAHEDFCGFARKQKLEDLVQSAAKELERGKIYHFKHEMVKFYFPE